MDAEITLKNYRCFPDSKPARFVVRDGFTAFLGVNNSGKSAILKSFVELRSMFQILAQPGNHLAASMRQGGEQTFNLPSHVTDPAELFYNGNDRNLEMTVRLFGTNDAFTGNLPAPDQVTLTLPRTNRFSVKYAVGGKERLFREESLDCQGPFLRIGGNPDADFSQYQQLFRDLSSTIYIGPFRNALNLGSQPSYFDISVGQAFIQWWRSSKTGYSKSQNEAIHNLTEDIRRIFEFRQLEINSSADDQTLRFFINNRSYSLSELGSGLLQFVLVLANAAVAKPAFILIDEPELNLHPSLQLDFLTTLGSYSTRGVLFSTHSYGLARARAQQVYTLRYDPDTGSDLRALESTPQLSELLGELSFSAYRELGFDKILLVEGVTEVLAIQQFLRLYEKDHKIIIIPLGGSNFINARRQVELEEIIRITPKVFALIDSERTAPKAPLERDRAEFQQACSSARIHCHVLERRATENYLSETAVQEVLGTRYHALGPFERLKDLNPAWSKNQNWRIARMMTKSELDTTDLGQFLLSL